MSSMQVFPSYQYHTLYAGILSSDVILGAVNFGNHWCSVAIFLSSRIMVYLDSLYQGTSAKQSFERMQNFLECAQQCASQSIPLDCKEWLFYNLPCLDLSQQLNSDDCGVFVAKWAQHNALGLPLDFTQKDIQTFRFSMILKICNGDPSLQIEQPPHLDLKNENRINAALPKNTKRRRNMSLKHSICVNSNRLNPLEAFSDADDDFQPRKKVKSLECDESSNVCSNDVNPASNCNSSNKQTVHNPVISDHCYSSAKNSVYKRIDRCELPVHVKNLLPTSYTYKLIYYEDKECFTGPPREAFMVHFTISNMTSEEQVKTWVSELASLSKIKYNLQEGYK
jgi:hypothetical protein